jgi:hypothetical protein
MRRIVLVGLSASLACGEAPNAEISAASESPVEAAAPPAAAAAVAPCANHNPLKSPFFGDLHTHTSYSGDAYAFDTRNTPLDAYAFARGKPLQISGGNPTPGPITKIDRPLDFLAVTDHSEFLAAAYGCGNDTSGTPYDPTKTIYDTPQCQNFRDRGNIGQFAAMFGVQWGPCANGACDGIITTAWQREQQAAAAAYERCAFTTFVAYEWSRTENGSTLHKNVIFPTEIVPSKPFDSLTYTSQEQLWSALAAAGSDALTIPHNSNLSNGLAFAVPSGAVDLANMGRYQKLAEIFQHKGGSECLSEDDPDCRFEVIPGRDDPQRDKPAYVRDVLKKGLALQATTGSNPLTLGFVGATDTHNGTPGNVRESTFPGHVASIDDEPRDRIKAGAEARHYNPGGVTAVWAEENTRESVFAALARRETYATSGPRMVVRFYESAAAGDLCADPLFPKQLVEGGAVPMGGTFHAAAPRFVVRAWKDAASLARVDIVKAWVDGQGAVQEKVVRTPLGAGSDASACVTWTDDDATPGPALYYARVLEVPTPRWSAYDCVRAPFAAPLACAPNGELRVAIQERAWTSPIWRLP